MFSSSVCFYASIVSRIMECFIVIGMVSYIKQERDDTWNNSKTADFPVFNNHLFSMTRHLKKENLFSVLKCLQIIFYRKCFSHITFSSNIIFFYKLPSWPNFRWSDLTTAIYIKARKRWAHNIEKRIETQEKDIKSKLKRCYFFFMIGFQTTSFNVKSCLKRIYTFMFMREMYC